MTRELIFATSPPLLLGVAPPVEVSVAVSLGEQFSQRSSQSLKYVLDAI
jgi:hypothetical protein